MIILIQLTFRILTFRARDKTFNYDFNMMGTFESQDTNSIWSWGDAMTNIFVVGALRESHLGALHKGATYQGSGMPDTRRDLFSLSTMIGPPRAATVREILTRSAPRAGDCEYSDSTSRYRRSRQFALFVIFCHSGHSIYFILFFAMYQDCALYKTRVSILCENKRRRHGANAKKVFMKILSYDIYFIRTL